MMKKLLIVGLVTMFVIVTDANLGICQDSMTTAQQSPAVAVPRLINKLNDPDSHARV